MTAVEQWLRGIGLEYALAAFDAAGITTPDALAELEASHFAALGVVEAPDRRKLFFLVQRVKTAKSEEKEEERKSVKQEIDDVVTSKPERQKTPRAQQPAAPGDDLESLLSSDKELESSDGDSEWEEDDDEDGEEEEEAPSPGRTTSQRVSTSSLPPPRKAVAATKTSKLASPLKRSVHNNRRHSHLPRHSTAATLKRPPAAAHRKSSTAIKPSVTSRKSVTSAKDYLRRQSSSGWSTDDTNRGRSVHSATNTKSFAQQIEHLRQQNCKSSDPNDDPQEEMRIRVVVRKRPMSGAEIAAAGNVDVIHPIDHGSYGRILFYQPKTRVDLTKEVETIPFSFDNVFGENSTNQQIYERCVRHLIPCLFDGQWVSIFAYGQTASGKTYTMMGANMTTGNSNESKDNLGLYYMAALDIFQALQTPGFDHYQLGISLFEIYGGKLFDLLNERQPIKCLEDSKGKVQFPGLTEHGVAHADNLMQMMNRGACHRSTGTTSRNADSSRSHAVLQLHLRSKDGSEFSRLTFIDLAGSERGADTTSSDRRTRLEGAEINTSLLALKEVIRALATGDTMVHVPFRGSKLTQVLKESFVGRNCRSVMVACISPNIGNCEQTLNTLRYADRVKERNSHTGELSNVVATAAVKTMAEAKPRMLRVPSGGSSAHSASSDLLDELLSSPQVKAIQKQPSKAPTSTKSPEQPSPASTAAETSESRSAALHVIATHKEAMTQMLEVVKEEMDLVNLADAERKGLEDYTATLAEIHERQLDLFASIRASIKEYHAVQAATTAHLLADDDDSFDDDLRD